MTNGTPKHIAIFSTAYLPFVGGAEVAVKEITDRIPPGDFSFTCFTYRFDGRWPSEEKIGNISVIRPGQAFVSAGREKDYYGHHWKKLRGVFSLWRAAEKEHRRQPFQAIWAIMASYGGLAALLFKLRHPRTPFLLTLQEGDSEKHILRRIGIFYPFWKLILRKANHIQVISYYLADFARRHGAKCPIGVVPNGVDLDRIKNKELRIKNDRNNSKSIITTSRLVPKNGVDILIHAAAELKKLHASRFTIQVVGDGPEQANLKKLAVDLVVADYVEFTGAVPSEKIPEYLSRADIFVRVSRSEGLGNSFLEAMAAGLAVIGTNVGGIPDFLKDEETGLFARVDDPIDCAQKIKRLMDDSGLRQRLSENSKKLVSEKYNWKNIAIKMESIFNRLIHDS